MNYVDRILGLFAPQVCVSCGVEGAVLCSDCITAFYEPIEPRCAGCKSLCDDFRVCSACRSWLPLKHIYVVSRYEGIYEDIVRSLKFSSRRQASEAMVQVTKETNFMREIMPEALLCPIPTAPKRVRERGFDHALLFAKELGYESGSGMAQILRRHTNVRQLGASRTERLKQMVHEFEVVDTGLIKGKKIVLIDDVMTTGATLSAAAKLLKKAGAKEVSAIIFAQKQ